MAAKTAQTKTTLKTIPVDRIDRDPNQPRQEFDADKLALLGKSMQTVGQLQAITVRYVPETRRYTLIMGERRWRAAQLIGKRTLDAQVQHGVDDEGAFAMATAENVGRVDMTPMEEARAFKRLRDAGMTLEQVCDTVAKSSEYVTWRIDLLNLVPDAAGAVEKGNLPVGAAWYVCRLSPNAQQTFMAKWARGQFPTARDAEAYAQACREKEAAIEQGGLFHVQEMTEEEKQEVRAERKRLTSKIDRLSTAGEILQEIAGMDPAELARLLSGAEGGVGAYRTRVNAIKDYAAKASVKLRKAAAISAVAAAPLTLDAPAEEAEGSEAVA